MTDRTAGTRPPKADAGATAEFERLYRANVDAVTAYFVRGHAPAGDIVVGVHATPNGRAAVSQTSSLPAPACISPPAPPQYR